MLQRNVLIAFLTSFAFCIFSVIKCFFYLVPNTASLVISICYCPVPFFPLFAFLSYCCYSFIWLRHLSSF